MAVGQQMISAALLGLAEREHALYRFYDAADVLLYAGISVDPILRMKAHRREKDWWTQVRSMTVEPFPTRKDALDAEAEAIRTEKPLYNVQHNEMVGLPAPRSSDTDAVAYAKGAHDLAKEILEYVVDEPEAWADVHRRASRHWSHRYADETVNLAIGAMEQAFDRYADLEQSLTWLLHALPFGAEEVNAIEAAAIADLDGFYGPGMWTDVELLGRRAYYVHLRFRPFDSEEDRLMGDPQGYRMSVNGRAACECEGR